ncbi:MAG: hypothetical protein R3E44_00480 [Paracoccaceae bacterium]
MTGADRTPRTAETLPPRLAALARYMYNVPDWIRDWFLELMSCDARMSGWEVDDSLTVTVIGVNTHELTPAPSGTPFAGTKRPFRAIGAPDDTRAGGTADNAVETRPGAEMIRRANHPAAKTRATLGYHKPSRSTERIAHVTPVEGVAD